MGKRSATHQIALAYVVGGAALTHRCRFPGGRRWVPGAGAKPGGCAPEAARQHSSPVAGLLLTTEGMIAEAPKEDDHAHGAPGGGMGGMGGMDM